MDLKSIPPSFILRNSVTPGIRALCPVSCPHPHVANYKGSGSTNDASNFVCGQQVVQGKAVLDSERCAFKANERVFGVPFVPSGF
jgi:hypothetical protein